MKKVIICDDDEKIVSQLSQMIENLFPKQFQICGYVSPRQLMYEIEDDFLKSVDLLFVDLEMGEMDGTDVAKFVQRKLPMTKIIFITGYLQRTEDIFDEIYPAGLLLKPLNEEKLEKYIKKELEEPKPVRKFIKVKKDGSTFFIPMEEVFYVESNRRKLILHMKNEMECVYERISNFCEMYPEEFVRCHQSYAVNWNYVVEVTTSEIKLKGGLTVPISRQKYREIRTRIFR